MYNSFPLSDANLQQKSDSITSYNSPTHAVTIADAIHSLITKFIATSTAESIAILRLITATISRLNECLSPISIAAINECWLELIISASLVINGNW